MVGGSGSRCTERWRELEYDLNATESSSETRLLSGLSHREMTLMRAIPVEWRGEVKSQWVEDSV